MKLNKTTKLSPMYFKIATGIISEILISIICTVILTWLINRGSVKEDYMKSCVLLIAAVASFFGVVVSLRRVKEKKILIGTLTAISFVFILFMLTSLLFDGQYHKVTVTVLSILIGGAMGYVASRNRKKRTTSRRAKTRYR